MSTTNEVKDLSGDTPNVLYNEVRTNEWVWKDPVEMRYRKNAYQLFIDNSKSSRSAPRFQLCAQSMKMTAPFGFEVEEGLSLQDMIDKPGGKLKIQLNVIDDQLVEFIKSLDTLLMTQAKTHRALWWPGKTTKDDNKIEKDMKSLLKVDENGKYPDKVKIKVITNGKRKTQILKSISDTAFVDSDPTCVTAGTQVIPIVECGGVWISGLGFGMDLIATELLVFPNHGRKRGFDMILETPMHEVPQSHIDAESDLNDDNECKISDYVVQDTSNDKSDE